MKWAALVLAVVAVALLAWGAGEFHYRNCVNAAVAEHPAGEPDLYGDDPTADARRNAINRCSRLPWK